MRRRTPLLLDALHGLLVLFPQLFKPRLKRSITN